MEVINLNIKVGRKTILNSLLNLIILSPIHFLYSKFQIMRSMRPSKKKLAQWEYKKHQLSQLQQNSEFELYLLSKPEQLKKQFIEQVPYYWCHSKIGRDREFQIHLNELNNNDLEVKGFPYVDNLLQAVQQCKGNFKIICQADNVERVLQYHSDNKRLVCIHVFDLQLQKKLSIIPRSKKLEIKASEFKTFKRTLYRKNYEKNETETFMNCTRITNWDIAEVNQSRLVLKTLLVAKNDQKGKEDFLRLANVVEQQLGKVAEYEMSYSLQATPQQAIKWYTKESFYHRLVNNTLKAGKGNPLLLSYIRFPVKQLHSSIKQLYTTKQLHKQSFECYRGGRIGQKQLQFYRSNKNGFIEMQGFLSCSKNKEQMSEFIVNCVFKIVVNNLEREKEWDHGFCFLDTVELTEFIKEEQVLFNVFCVMEIKDVTRQIYGSKQVDVITLEYGSLASLLYQKKHGLVLKDREHSEMCIKNYMALKPYYDSINNQVDCFRFFGKYKEVEQYYTTFLAHLQKQNSKDNDKYFNAYFNLGQNYLSLKSYHQAKDFLLKGKQLMQSSEMNIQDQLRQSRIYNGLGIANKNLNKPIEAKQNYLKTIQLIEKSRNKNQKVYLATAYNNLAAILVQESQQEQAMGYYHKSLNLLEGEENQTIANVHFNLGLYHLRKSTFKQSIRNLIKSLQIYNKLFGTHKSTITCHIKLGEAYLKNGSTEYNKHFDTAMDMMKNLAFVSRQEYIETKRQIQDLKSTHQRHLTRGASSSIDSYQMQDVLSFMKNNEQVERYLSKQSRKQRDNSQKFYSEHQVFSYPMMKNKNTIQNSSAVKLDPPTNISSLESMLFGNNLRTSNNNKNPSSLHESNININNSQPHNQNDKLRQLRGKNILDSDIPATYDSITNSRFRTDNDIAKSQFMEKDKKPIQETGYQDMVDAKLAIFNKNDFVTNLKQGRQRKNLIFG